MRIYVDTSVFGGYYDDEFKKSTVPLFHAFFAGQAFALISETLVAELVEAPERVRHLLEHLLNGECERLMLTEEALALRDAYVAARVVSPKWAEDALHVAHASLAQADAIASWNFKHLVNPLRIRGFNTVNAQLGYGPLAIMTPDDIVRSWKEDGNEPEEETI